MIRTRTTLADHIDQKINVLNHLKTHEKIIETLVDKIFSTLQNKGKIFLIGNGGSAADAQHLAAEFMVKYRAVRSPLPAVALTTDTSILTAHSNDFDFETIFERQVLALCNPQDCLLALSTSGTSKNIINGLLQGL